MAKTKQKMWAIHWWYSDNSSSGILPRILNNTEKELVEEILKYIEIVQNYSFVEVYVPCFDEED